MIDYVIFDFGRVIVDFDETKMTRAYVKDERLVPLVRDTVFDRKYWDLLDLGTISDEEVKAGIASRLSEPLAHAAYDVYDNWIAHVDILDGIEDAILTAKARAKGIYLLSNISPQFVENYYRYPTLARILSHFDGLVFSGVLHMVKPDARIFNHLLDTYGVPPEKALFIDDSQKNIDGAHAVGIQTYLFDGDTQKLKNFLEKNVVLSH